MNSTAILENSKRRLASEGSSVRSGRTGARPKIASQNANGTNILCLVNAVRLITQSRLSKVVVRVQGELARLGLWSDVARLPRTEVFWCALPQLPLGAMGYFIHDAHPWMSLLGYRPGHIYIPAFTFVRRNISDVIRHEYGHTLAHYQTAWVRRSRAFTAAFGGRYSLGRRPASVRRADCVSDYATTEPTEVFAETFVHFVRRAGRLPARATAALRRKWDFIARLCEEMQAAR